MKKMAVGSLLIVMTALVLAACGGGDKGKAETETALQTETATEETETTLQTEESVIETEETKAVTSAQAYDAYREAVLHFRNTGEFPDGECVSADTAADPEASAFAVTDVDGDGIDELIIAYNGGYMAELRCMILAYDEENEYLYTELSGFPSMSFFSNQVIQVGVSHNQGFAGEFWPYSIYFYNPETDGFELTYFADAWDSSISDEDYNGNPFPSEIDEDEDGIVYYLREIVDGEYVGEPMDKESFAEVMTEIMGNASALEIPYMTLTDDNIDTIGN